METSESLSIESFSYSWLVNLKQPFESPKGSFRSSFDAFDESSYIEMDPKLSASKRFLVFHQDFDFDLPTLQRPCVHADELISNGILVPLFLKPLDVGIYDDSGSNSTSASPMSSTTLENPYRGTRSISFRRYTRLPKRVVQKYLNLVRLIWVRIKKGKFDSNDVQTAKNWGFSGAIESYDSDNWSKSWVLESAKSCTSSPRISEAYGVDNWRRSCDSESSIYEAVLHCKKTIGCK